MADGASIGEVYVDVVPRVGSLEQLRATLLAQGSKVGDEVGTVIGKSISDRIAKGITDGLGKSQKEPATRQGTEAGGAFASSLKKAIEAGLKSLPKVTIDGDSTPAQRAVAELRAEMEALASKTIGVNITGAEARAEMDRLIAKADELGAKHPEIEARVDLARASAELAAFNAEVDRIDGRTARVDVDTSAAVGGMRNLTAAGIALGPAIVPGAAAAVAAIAAIAPVAIGAAAGIGVIALAFSGVMGAVKAMGTADDQAGQAATSLAGKQNQVAAASNAVRQAQASLANTVANVADQQRRAAEQVSNAQRSLNDAKINADRANAQAVQAITNAETTRTRAQRDALQAQKDLTQAAQDAKRANEDLANQVVDNGFAQQRAVLAVSDAEKALANARRALGPNAARQRQEAQLAFDEAKQHLLEIGQQGQRLAADKADADAKGIEGSKQVVAATKRVQDTQQQVASAELGVSKARADAANTARVGAESILKAQQGVADAQAAQATQARQSAFAVAQAQQAVADAQRGVQTATVAAGTAGGAAMNKLQQAMADLSPEGRRFATFLYGLKPALLDLRHAAEAGLLPGVQAGIEALLPLLPRVAGFVRTLGTELGSLAQHAGQALAAPFWQDFFHMLGSSAIPAMENAARTAGNFAVGIAGLVRALLPLGQDVGGGLIRFSEQFAAHALTIQQTQGYKDFLNYVREQGPIVAHTIGEVVQAAVRLVEAIAPIGGATLTAIRLLAETINALPVGVLTVFAGGIVTVVTASKGLAVVRDLWFSSFGIGFVQMMTNAQIAMSLAATNGAGKLATAASGARAAFGTLASSIGAGGALGIGIGAAVVGVGLISNALEKSKQRTEQLTSSLGQLLDVYRKTGTLSNTASADLLKQNKNLADLVLNTDKYGVSINTMLDAQAGVPGTYQTIEAAETKLRNTQGGLTNAQQEGFNALKGLAKQGERNVEIDKALGLSHDAAAGAADRHTDAERRSTEVAKNQTPQQAALGQALRTVADASSTATEKASALKAADEALFGAERKAITSEQDQALSLIAVAKAGEQNAKQQMFGKATLDLHSEASIRNRQMLEQRFLALGDEYLADVRSGQGLDDAKQKHDTNRDAIIKAAKAAHFDADEVQHLADKFGTLPTDPKVVVTVSGVKEVMTQLEQTEIANFALRNGLNPDEAIRQYRHLKPQGGGFNQGGFATGGPVFGAGGPTDDKIPAWLSNGEHVITAAEVQAAGGHGAIEQIRRMLLGSRQPQALYPGDGSAGLAFAAGGAVQRPLTQARRSENWPVSFPLRVKIPSMEELRRIALFGPGFTGDISGGLAAAAAFVKNQVGKPYIWASAGPYGYDCSGIVSAAYNVARGRNPYSHTFSTMNEAPYFPLPGYGPFTAAWTNPGERGPGGSNVGHTAAKIGNYAFESVGGQGVRDHGVTPLGSFAHIGHYDSGGILPPGLTIARNDTGTNEFVFTGDQLKSIGGGGATITQHIYPQRGQSEPEIAAAASRQLAWELR